MRWAFFYLPFSIKFERTKINFLLVINEDLFILRPLETELQADARPLAFLFFFV